MELEFSVDRPVAMVAARLSDVAPSGQATRVTYGLLNLNRRSGRDEPEALVPGRRYRARVRLNGVAQVFPPGHRIRLSLSTSYWPLAWPPPEPVMLTVYGGSSTLRLPVRPTTEPDGTRGITEGEPFGPPEAAEPLSTTRLEPGDHRWEVHRDLVNYGQSLEIVKDNGVVRYDDIGMDVARRAYERYDSVADDFSSVSGESTWTMGFRRREWDARTVTHTALSCTPTDFVLHATLDAYENDRRVFSRTWNDTIPRDHL